MKPNFPLKNMAVNEVIRLRQSSFIREYTNYIKTSDQNYKRLFEMEMETLFLEFDHMSEEIHQVIFTANDFTKRALFEELKKNILDYGLFEVDRNQIIDICLAWNEMANKNFEEKVKLKEQEYFNKPERKKYKHLEAYKIPNNIPLTLRFGESTQRDFLTYVNYNYLCVEESADLIDCDFIGSYIELLTVITEKLKEILKPLIEQYESGSFMEKKSDSTLYDRFWTKVKNNPVLATFMIIAVILTSLFSFFEPFKEFIFPKKVLVFSTIKEKRDSANSMLDVYLRNKSDEDVIVHKLEFIITEREVDTSTITKPIGPVLGGSAVYDYLINMKDSLYSKDISYLIKSKSVDRFFVIVALGSWDSKSKLIQSETNETGDVINDIEVRGLLRATFNENDILESGPFSIKIRSKGNSDLIAKSGIDFESYVKLLNSDDFIEALHGIDLISLIGGGQATSILTQFRNRDLTYLKTKYSSNYKPIDDSEMEVKLFQPTPEERYNSFLNYLNYKISKMAAGQ